MSQAFVAMPFSRRFDPVFEAIRAVCDRLGVHALRVDEVVGVGDVYQLIEKEIARSELVVADCTGDPDPRTTNPNVALEVGLARALRKYVVLLTQGVDSLPFDLRTQRALQYENTTDGLSDLRRRLHPVVRVILSRTNGGNGTAPALPPAEKEPEVPYLFLRTNDRGHEEYLSGRDEREVVLVPGGIYYGGSPARPVHVPVFFIDKYPVTNQDYRRFAEEAGHAAPYFWDWDQPGHEEEPVVGVSWDDAAAFARWAGKELPRSDEWEKAARGIDGRPFPWGDAEPDAGKAAFRSLFGQGPARPCPVGRSTAGVSPCGCHDMAGNVWEWLDEWHVPSRARALAGGSIASEPSSLLASARLWADPDRVDYPAVGFRCVKRLGPGPSDP